MMDFHVFILLGVCWFLVLVFLYGILFFWSSLKHRRGD